MRYYIIAGEASGDLHASNLMKEIKFLDNKSIFRGWGGDLMQLQGMELVKHYKELAFMGFVEVLANLGTIFNNLKICKYDIIEFKPDALILIDYPGFNLRIAEWASKNNIRVFYYISPQVWAWHQSRIKKMKKYIERLFVILPFEKEFFSKHQMDVNYVGHPLLDAIESYKCNDNNEINGFNNSDKPVVAILPGSRRQEIKTMLPYMLNIAKEHSDLHFVIAAVNSVPEYLYTNLHEKTSNISIIYGQTYNLLKIAKYALVTSGTATLETALFKVPQIVCYKGSFISYLIARNFIKVKYISLVNLIMDKPLVKELIQNEMNLENLKNEFSRLLNDKKYILEILAGYNQLDEILGGKGASANTAKLLYNRLINK